MKKISVIIPVYNGEKFINETELSAKIEKEQRELTPHLKPTFMPLGGKIINQLPLDGRMLKSCNYLFVNSGNAE